ncbi:MAG: MFS transporter [Mycoplasmatales bacterium]
MKKQERIILFVLFVVFISLGFPDGLLGSGWPSISSTYNFKVEVISYLTTGVFIGSFCSSMLYAKYANRYKITTIINVSTGFIIIGLLMFTFGNNPLTIFLAISCLGVGGGGIDVAVNDYVACNYNERIMTWVHGFWGVGISTGSFVIATVLALNLDWKIGYYIIASLELVILILVMFKQDLFKVKFGHQEATERSSQIKFKLRYLFGPVYYFFYGAEYVLGMFLSTYLITASEHSISQAAFVVSLYWTALMTGRFTTGLITDKIATNKLLILHLSCAISGSLLLFVQNPSFDYVAVILIGYGLSALYPIMMSLPYRVYSPVVAQKVIAYQVASAMLGVVFVPIICGFIFKTFNILLLPFIVIFCLLVMIVMVILVEKNKEV